MKSKYTYEIHGDLASRQARTTVTVEVEPNLWSKIEEKLIYRFRNYAVGAIRHSATGVGTIVINEES